MRLVLVALLSLTLAVPACGRIGESRINPMNWFGGSRDERPDLGPTSDITDNRALVVRVTELSIERTSSGALIRAEGLTRSAGWWDAQLVPENNGVPLDGVLSFRFVAAAPREPVPDTGERSRTLVVAYPVSTAILEQTSAVVVNGQENSRRARR